MKHRCVVHIAWNNYINKIISMDFPVLKMNQIDEDRRKY
jgi:hypothetical protein